MLAGFDVFFLEFVAGYIAGKAIDAMGGISRQKLDDALTQLERNPHAPDVNWQAELRDEQKHLLRSLRLTQNPQWWGWKAKIVRKTERPIALIGPSGAGKTKIALRLANEDPNVELPSSTTLERQKMLAYSRYNSILVAPGEIRHGYEGFGPMREVLESTKPPKVVCVVVADGFHATESNELLGTYKRPGREDFPSDVESFLDICRDEEIESLLWYLSMPKVKKRIPALITIVNKRDLWAPRHKGEHVPKRYTDRHSDYTKKIQELARTWGFDPPATHDVVPLFCVGGGFHPDQTIPAFPLTVPTAKADAMILEALLYYRYTEGTLRFD